LILWEQKWQLVQGITDAMVDSYGVPAETVQVWFQDTPKESYGVAGKLVSD